MRNKSVHDLNIRYRPLREIEPFANNARTHTDRQIAKLRTSLARFGWTNPMLTAGNALIAGHARLRAALAMAADNQPIARNPDPWTGPTIDLSHLTAAERRAYLLADNRLAEDAGWDKELLGIEFGELMAMEFDLSLTGFGAKEIEALSGTVLEVDPQLDTAVSFQVLIEARDETHQAELLERFRTEGLTCKPLML